MADQEKPARRPAAPRDAKASPAPEKAVEGARSRVPDEEARKALVEAEVITQEEADEIATRVAPRTRQIHAGEVHFFIGGALARETR